jgi:hypothetical protein
MQETVSRIEREAAEDIFYGQVVINWARWFVILAGTVLVMMAADTTTELAYGMAPVVGLMVVNFYLHGRRLVNKPANLKLVTVSSVIDVLLITAVVMIGPREEVSGMNSQFYVLYFPVIAAFAFVSARNVSVGFTGIAAAVYVAACVVAGESGSQDIVQKPFATSETIESIATRVIMMLAIGGLATYFWKVQRDRRHEQMPAIEE